MGARYNLFPEKGQNPSHCVKVIFLAWAICWFALQSNCCRGCHWSFPWNWFQQGPTPFWTASIVPEQVCVGQGGSELDSEQSWVIAHVALCSEVTLALVVLITWRRFLWPWTRAVMPTPRFSNFNLILNIESANPPHAVAPILTGYEHHWNWVGMANNKKQCGSPGDARTEWNYSPYPASRLTSNNPAYPAVTSDAWLSYQISTFQTICIN